MAARAQAPGFVPRTLGEVPQGDYARLRDGSWVRVGPVLNGQMPVRRDDDEPRCGPHAMPADTKITGYRATLARVADTTPVADPLAGASDRGLDLFRSEDP